MCMENVTLTKKDIIAINQKFAEGYFENESSLEFALSLFKQNIPWTKQLAYLLRAVLIDHVFSDGNKRTGCMLLMTYVDMAGYKLEEKRAIEITKKIVLKNIKSINTIRRMIEDGITKK